MAEVTDLETLRYIVSWQYGPEVAAILKDSDLQKFGNCGREPPLRMRDAILKVVHSGKPQCTGSLVKCSCSDMTGQAHAFHMRLQGKGTACPSWDMRKCAASTRSAIGCLWTS